MSFTHGAMNVPGVNRTRSAPVSIRGSDVPTAVTNLVASTRQLQDALRKWSYSQMSESNVSDVYVTVGNDFHAAVVAFTFYQIDMRDIISFPNELRAVLERCLSEDPTPQTLDTYMPRVRQIIAKLLQGLRSRQAAYWQAVRVREGGYP